MASATLQFHGAAGEVTGSCSLLTLAGQRWLVDCGSFQGGHSSEDRNLAAFPFDPKGLDALVLTHAHLDHVGRVPFLLARGFSGPIFTHPATRQIAEIVWLDSVKLAGGEGSGWYDEATVQRTLKLCRPLGYGTTATWQGVGLTLYDAGHILGSAHAVLEGDGRRVLFSGDIGKSGTPILRDPSSVWDRPADLIVCESTYGNRAHRGASETLAELAGILRDAVARRGMILIPAFAIGRTQEILYHIHDLFDRGQVPRIPVLLDSPMAAKVSQIYRDHPELYDAEAWQRLEQGEVVIGLEGLRQIGSSDESRLLRGMTPPALVIAGSGMCTGGRILNHLKTFLPRESTTVLFVGFQGRGTLGRRLVEGERSLRIQGQEIPARARICTLNGFSAHADQAGLLAWARGQPRPPAQWLVNHGEPEGSQGLATELSAAGLGPALAIGVGQSFGL